jgi:hypothetical protein
MGTILGNDEQILREETLIVNLVEYWLKAKYSLTNKRVTGIIPNTIFGIIPYGQQEVAYPLKNISSVSISTKFRVGNLLIGLIFILIALAFHNALSFIIFGLVGLISILNCYTASFDITNNAGQKTGYILSILEKAKVESFVTEVNTAIVNST